MKPEPQIAPAVSEHAAIVYVGPPEQMSPDLGPLVSGRSYQVKADLAAYLCATHPEYWQAARPPKE